MSEAKMTTDHDIIRRWAEERDGRPATVAATQDGTAGILRIGFQPEEAEDLNVISWDDFFAKFDKEKLVFLYQDTTENGGISRFHKFVDRETARKAS